MVSAIGSQGIEKHLSIIDFKRPLSSRHLKIKKRYTVSKKKMRTGFRMDYIPGMVPLIRVKKLLTKRIIQRESRDDNVFCIS